MSGLAASQRVAEAAPGNDCKRRVLIIHPEGNFSNNPSLLGLIELLLEHEVAIDLRYRKSKAAPISKAQVRNLPSGFFWAELRKFLVDRLPLPALSRGLAFLERWFCLRRYDAVIGVDRQGLVEACELSRATGIPLIFLSFEILFSEETSTRFKAIEKKAAPFVVLWITQDPLRASHLRQQNALSESTQFLLPLASTGLGQQGVERMRDDLGIPAQARVAIVIGSIAGWSMTSEILASVPEWPQDWVLLVHERYGRTAEQLRSLDHRLQALVGQRIFFSSAASASVDDMAYVFSGVDLGLAFYRPDYATPFTGRNLLYLGLASGKISTYLRYGLPILINEIGLLSREALRAGFGYVVASPAELGALLPHIDTEKSADCAQRYFSEHLDFMNFKNELWLRLEPLLERSARSVQ